MATAPRTEKARILVVDDDPVTVAFVVDLLEQEGYAAHACLSGPEAIAYAAAHPVDLVVQDVRMPGMDGLATARELKKLFGPESFVPVILLSALATEEDKIAGLSSADDYVVKPFSRVELLARIQAFLRIRGVHRELAQAKRLYQGLYENAPFMSLALDGAGTISGCNAAFMLAVGLARESIVGRPLAAFFAAEERAPLAHFIDVLSRAEGIRREATFTLQPAAEGAAPVAVALRAVHFAVEPAVAVVVVMQDISARLRLEEERRMARLQLYRSARLTSLGTLASGIAHELNNPLTAILGFSSALLDRFKRDRDVPREELEEYLGVINAETLRCRDIVETLSSFARDREAQVSDVPLADCVADAVRLLLPRAQKRGIAIVNHVPAGLSVRADSGRLGQVVVNILSNSLDFMNEPGTVVVEAQAQSGPPSVVRVTISDDGPGIAPDVLPKVFDPFFSTKEVGKGMGLGLTMCHTILKEFGGSIDVLSEGGAGTTVVLEIPGAQEG